MIYSGWITVYIIKRNFRSKCLCNTINYFCHSCFDKGSIFFSIRTGSSDEYNFISNELFVAFRTRDRAVRAKGLGLLGVTRTVTETVMTVTDLEQALSDLEAIGPPDYADEGMLQYLRTERIVPPYQTRGYKLVELVRIYEVGATPRRTEDDG